MIIIIIISIIISMTILTSINVCQNVIFTSSLINKFDDIFTNDKNIIIKINHYNKCYNNHIFNKKICCIIIHTESIITTTYQELFHEITTQYKNVLLNIMIKYNMIQSYITFLYNNPRYFYILHKINNSLYSF
jgi:hypothetical protein